MLPASVLSVDGTHAANRFTFGCGGTKTAGILLTRLIALLLSSSDDPISIISRGSWSSRL